MEGRELEPESNKMGRMFQLAAQCRKLHYSFTYRMLPLMLFGENGLDVWNVLASGDEQALPFLKEAWDRTAKSQNLEYFEPEGMRTSLRLGEFRDVVVITLPEPLYPPEAYYAIVQFDREIDKLHFYTIEYSVRMDGSKRVVLGKTLPGGQRHNMGALPSSDIELGLDEIDRKSAHLFPFERNNN
jgi:hypothetical protein